MYHYVCMYMYIIYIYTTTANHIEKQKFEIEGPRKWIIV